MWDCTDLLSVTGSDPSDRSVINHSVIDACVIDTNYEEWREIDTDTTTGPYLDVMKNGTPRVARPVLDHVILHAKRFVSIRSFPPSDSLKDRNA
jgi:hypothetical protein